MGNARVVINEVALRCMRTLVDEPDKYLTSSNRPLDKIIIMGAYEIPDIIRYLNHHLAHVRKVKNGR